MYTTRILEGGMTWITCSVILVQGVTSQRDRPPQLVQLLQHQNKNETLRNWDTYNIFLFFSVLKSWLPSHRFINESHSGPRINCILFLSIPRKWLLVDYSSLPSYCMVLGLTIMAIQFTTSGGLQTEARGPPAAFCRVLYGPGRLFHKIQCVMNIET